MNERRLPWIDLYHNRIDSVIPKALRTAFAVLIAFPRRKPGGSLRVSRNIGVTLWEVSSDAELRELVLKSHWRMAWSLLYLGNNYVGWLSHKASDAECKSHRLENGRNPSALKILREALKYRLQTQ